MSEVMLRVASMSGHLRTMMGMVTENMEASKGSLAENLEKINKW